MRDEISKNDPIAPIKIRLIEPANNANIKAGRACNGKLSKRDGDRLGFPVFPIQWTNPDTGEVSSGYRESGYIAEAFINMLVFLGWNPGISQEIFSIEELCKIFTLERVGKSGAKFDFDKTRWFNQQYLRSKTKKDLAKELKIILEKKNLKPHSDEYIEEVCEQLKERATFTAVSYTHLTLPTKRIV